MPNEPSAHACCDAVSLPRVLFGAGFAAESPYFCRDGPLQQCPDSGACVRHNAGAETACENEVLVIDITDFDSLLTVAGRQEQPQRLLFVFLRASLPPGSDADQIRRYDDGEGGGLEPIMCVDKTVDELTTFSDLVEESGQLDRDWHIVLVASLSGRNGIAPSADEAEAPLNMMVQTVHNGGDLSGFVAFRKNGEPLTFG